MLTSAHANNHCNRQRQVAIRLQDHRGIIQPISVVRGIVVTLARRGGCGGRLCHGGSQYECSRMPAIKSFMRKALGLSRREGALASTGHPTAFPRARLVLFKKFFEPATLLRSCFLGRIRASNCCRKNFFTNLAGEGLTGVLAPLQSASSQSDVRPLSRRKGCCIGL